jgi:hypothetical protein
MACKQVIVLPPEIPMIYGLPARIQTFIPDMVPAIREVIAADPLSTKYGVEVEYILTDFIQFMMAPSKHARSRWDPHSRWERYNRKIHPKGKKPYPTWFLHRLRKYLSDHRATLVNNPRKTGVDRVPSHTKLVVVYLQPTDTAPRSKIRFSL